MALPNETLSREEVFLKAAALGDASNLPEPLTRVEEYLKYIAENGSGGGGTSNYPDLSNLPQINGTTLVGNKSLSDLGITQAIKKVADMIAGEFSTALAYETDDVVIYEDKLYIFTTDHAEGAWNAGQVQETTVAELIGSGGATPAPQTMASIELTESITQLQFAEMLYQAFRGNEHLVKLIVYNKTGAAIDFTYDLMPQSVDTVYTLPYTSITEITRGVFPPTQEDALLMSVECYGEAQDVRARHSFARFTVTARNQQVENMTVDDVSEVEYKKVQVAVEAVVQNENLIFT